MKGDFLMRTYRLPAALAAACLLTACAPAPADVTVALTTQAEPSTTPESEELARIRQRCTHYDDGDSSLSLSQNWYIYFDQAEGIFYFISPDGNRLRTCRLPEDKGGQDMYYFRWSPSENAVAIGYDAYRILDLQNDRQLPPYSIFLDSRFIEESGLTPDTDVWHQEMPAAWEDEGQLRVEIRFTATDGSSYTGNYCYDREVNTFSRLSLWPVDDKYGFSNDRMQYDLEHVTAQDLSSCTGGNQEFWFRDGSLFGLLTELPGQDLAVYGYDQPGASTQKGIVLRHGGQLLSFDWNYIRPGDSSLSLTDLNGDGAEELALVLPVGGGTDIAIDDLYLLTADPDQDGAWTSWAKLDCDRCQELLHDHLDFSYDRPSRTMTARIDGRIVSQLSSPQLPDAPIDAVKTNQFGLGGVWKFSLTDGRPVLTIRPTPFLEGGGRIWMNPITIPVTWDGAELGLQF